MVTAGLSTRLGRFAPRAGLIGAASIAACSVTAAVTYRGTDGEAYSPMNHYVSELGETGVSALAAIFNAGLIVGGICFAAFMVGLGERRGGITGAAITGLGAISGGAGALVGVFPMNQLGTHAFVAFAFFMITWIAIGLAALDLLLRPDLQLPFALAVLGLVVVGAFIAFLWVIVSSSSGRGGMSTGLEPLPVRSSFDAATILEWAAIIGTIAWTFAVATSWERARRVGGA